LRNGDSWSQATDVFQGRRWHSFVDGRRLRGEGAEWCRPRHCAVQLIILLVTGDASVGKTGFRMENLRALFNLEELRSV
jgi:hypothetical protein